jgi:flagellar export protein FliJ
MPFRFTLSTVLKLRDNLEQKEASILERRYAELAAAQGRLWEAEQNIVRAREERSEDLKQGVAAIELQLALQNETHLKRYRDALQQKLQEAQSKLREQIEIYKNARQQRDTLDQLRTQQFESYQREEAKSEQQQRDELHLMRHRLRE